MADRDLSRPYVGYRSAGRRPEAQQDRVAAANAPLAALRGWAAGTLGLPGDIESLGRMLIPGASEDTFMPTSERMREVLPGRVLESSPAGRLFTEAGTLTGGAGVATGARLAGRGAGALGRLAAEGIERGVRSGSPLMAAVQPRYVVKPKGGNWLSGSVEGATGPLKGGMVAGQTPAERIPLHEELLRDPALNADQLDRVRYQLEVTRGEDAINNWIDTKLNKYIRNEMGTPEDPLRALVLERGVSHVPLETLQEGAGWIPDEVALARKRAGFPEIGMVEEGSGQMYGDLSDLQRAASGWETAADVSIRGERAGDLMRLGEGSPTVRANPWLAKVPPETPVYSFKGFGEADLGFSHLLDELRNMLDPASGLPREFLLTPEQLGKITLPQAVERVARVNEWRAAQAAEANLAKARNPATFTVKEYPEQKMQWVELRSPEFKAEDALADMTESERSWFQRYLDGGDSPQEAFRGAVGDRLPMPGQKALEDALKYEGDTMGHCVGGYCPDVMAGRKRIYSLRDAKGEPHVTIEVRPPNKALMPYDYWYDRVGKDSPEVKEFLAWAQERKPARGDLGSMYEQWAKETGRPVETPPPEIVQIKGKGNRAPKEDYLPFVQDFVRSGQWSKVGDLGNTGLMRTDAVRAAGWDIGDINQPFLTKQEYDELLLRQLKPEGMKVGGEVKMAAGGAVRMNEGGLVDLEQKYQAGGLVRRFIGMPQVQARYAEGGAVKKDDDLRGLVNSMRKMFSLDTPQDMTPGETAVDIAAGFVPGLGTAQAARDFERARREGDKLGMGLSAVGMIPVVGGVVKPARKAVDPLAEMLRKYLDKAPSTPSRAAEMRSVQEALARTESRAADAASARQADILSSPETYKEVDWPQRFYRGIRQATRGPNGEVLPEVSSLIMPQRGSEVLVVQPNNPRRTAWAASNPLTASSFASDPNSLVVPLRLREKPDVVFNAEGLPWQRFFSQTGDLSRGSYNYPLRSEFKDMLRDPSVRSILVKDIFDYAANTSEGLRRLSELYGVQLRPENFLSDNLLIKDPSVVEYLLTKETPKMTESLKSKSSPKSSSKKEPTVKEQKMLQGFYRGYAGEPDVASSVFVTPQRAVGEYYANKRAAQTGAEPHLEMILADPFAGRGYGHSTLGTGKNPPMTTKARQLAPEDVKDRTKLYAEGGLVSAGAIPYEPAKIEAIVNSLREELNA